MTSSYCFRSRRLARRALMIRILSPRSVCTTTRNLSRCEHPKMMNRSSICECAGLKIVTDSGSPNTVAASSNWTPCLARFNRALLASHSKVSTSEIQTPFAPVVHPKLNTGKEPFQMGNSNCGVRNARQVANAEFGMGSTAAPGCRVRRPRRTPSPMFPAMALKTAPVAGALPPIVHTKMISAAAVFFTRRERVGFHRRASHASRISGQSGFRSGSCRAMCLIFWTSPSVQALSSQTLAASKSPN